MNSVEAMTTKLSTIQKKHNLNEVYRVDEKGAGGAHHKYKITRNKYAPFEEVVIAEIEFQHGARNISESTTGVTDQDLLEIVRDRLSCFCEGDLPSRETSMALCHVEEALMWLNKRIQDRAERGVLGTNEK